MARFKKNVHRDRKLRTESARFLVNLEAKKWCDLWHTHFDWDGEGDAGWVIRRQYLNALLRALSRARRELAKANIPYQLFAAIYPRSSGEDALYVHTANPNSTEFPIQFDDADEVQSLPPLLASRIDRGLYRVLKTKQGDFIILARIQGANSA
jgi:hypothetical protein